MGVTHVVDCRDEELKGKSYWFEPKINKCGITLFFETVKVHLTSEQLEAISKEWEENKIVVMNKAAEFILDREAKGTEA